MITDSTGNILESQAQAIVNTVNCVGVMGKGLALQFKRAYPQNFQAYASACKSGDVQLGSMFVFSTDSLDGPQWIINFPTKDHWRNESQLEYIREGLQDLKLVMEDLGITSIAIPPLGAGNGGLNWNDVRPVIVDSLNELDHVQVELYSPSNMRFPIQGQNIRMTWGREVITRLITGYLTQRVQSNPWTQSNSITELEIQKIMYFADRIEPKLGLQFTKGAYGPYSDKLRAILRDMEGSYLNGIGDASSKVLSLEPILVSEAAFASLSTATNEDSQNVASLVSRVLQTVLNYESPFSIELLASVDWVSRNSHLTSAQVVYEGISSWSPRKSGLFSLEDVSLALSHLRECELVDSKVSL